MMVVESRIQPSRLESILLFCLLLVVPGALILPSILDGSVFGRDSDLGYNATVNGFNYFDFGAVRRGLAGTFIRLVDHDLLVGTLTFHFVSVIAAAAALGVFYRSLRASAGLRVAAVTVLVAIDWRLGLDWGRTDPIIVALLVCASIAVLARRLIPALLLVGIGVFVHENSIVFGGPLLLGLVFLKRGHLAFDRRQLLGGAVVLGACFVTYLSFGRLPHADVKVIVDGIQSRLPPGLPSDMPLYFTLSGFRGVQASVCRNLLDPTYAAHVIEGLVLLALAWLALAPKLKGATAAILVGSVLPYLLMSFIATDISRWVLFACMSIWIIAVASPIQVDSRGSARFASHSFLGLLLLVLLNRYAGSIAPSAYLDLLAQKAGMGNRLSFDLAMQRCDPSWRDVLTGSISP